MVIDDTNSSLLSEIPRQNEANSSTEIYATQNQADARLPVSAVSGQKQVFYLASVAKDADAPNLSGGVYNYLTGIWTAAPSGGSSATAISPQAIPQALDENLDYYLFIGLVDTSGSATWSNGLKINQEENSSTTFSQFRSVEDTDARDALALSDLEVGGIVFVRSEMAFYERTSQDDWLATDTADAGLISVFTEVNSFDTDPTTPINTLFRQNVSDEVFPDLSVLSRVTSANTFFQQATRRSGFNYINPTSLNNPFNFQVSQQLSEILGTPNRFINYRTNNEDSIKAAAALLIMQSIGYADQTLADINNKNYILIEYENLGASTTGIVPTGTFNGQTTGAGSSTYIGDEEVRITAVYLLPTVAERTEGVELVLQRISTDASRKVVGDNGPYIFQNGNFRKVLESPIDELGQPTINLQSMKATLESIIKEPIVTRPAGNPSAVNLKRGQILEITDIGSAFVGFYLVTSDGRYNGFPLSGTLKLVKIFPTIQDLNSNTSQVVEKNQIVYVRDALYLCLQRQSSYSGQHSIENDPTRFKKIFPPDDSDSLTDEQQTILSAFEASSIASDAVELSGSPSTGGSLWGGPTRFTNDSSIRKVIYHLLAIVGVPCGMIQSVSNIKYKKVALTDRDSDFDSITNCGDTTTEYTTSFDAERITEIEFLDPVSDETKFYKYESGSYVLQDPVSANASLHLENVPVENFPQALRESSSSTPSTTQIPSVVSVADSDARAALTQTDIKNGGLVIVQDTDEIFRVSYEDDSLSFAPWLYTRPVVASTTGQRVLEGWIVINGSDAYIALATVSNVTTSTNFDTSDFFKWPTSTTTAPATTAQAFLIVANNQELSAVTSSEILDKGLIYHSGLNRFYQATVSGSQVSTEQYNLEIFEEVGSEAISVPKGSWIKVNGQLWIAEENASVANNQDFTNRPDITRVALYSDLKALQDKVAPLESMTGRVEKLNHLADNYSKTIRTITIEEGYKAFVDYDFINSNRRFFYGGPSYNDDSFSFNGLGSSQQRLIGLEYSGNFHTILGCKLVGATNPLQSDTPILKVIEAGNLEYNQNGNRSPSWQRAVYAEANSAAGISLNDEVVLSTDDRIILEIVPHATRANALLVVPVVAKLVSGSYQYIRVNDFPLDNADQQDWSTIVVEGCDQFKHTDRDELDYLSHDELLELIRDEFETEFVFGKIELSESETRGGQFLHKVEFSEGLSISGEDSVAFTKTEKEKLESLSSSTQDSVSETAEKGFTIGSENAGGSNYSQRTITLPANRTLNDYSRLTFDITWPVSGSSENQRGFTTLHIPELVALTVNNWGAGEAVATARGATLFGLEANPSLIDATDTEIDVRLIDTNTSGPVDPGSAVINEVVGIRR